MTSISSNLSSALQSARSALGSNATQVSTISRNISGVGDPDYIRRDASTITNNLGTTRVATQRYVNDAVYSSGVQANGFAVRAGVIATGLDQIVGIQDADGFDNTPSQQLSNLQQAVEFAASSPNDYSALSSLVEQGRTIAGSLNTSYNDLLAMRGEADKQIANSVETINQLLNDLTEINNTIVSSTQVGVDAFDSMDQRDRLIKDLSEEIGVRVIPAENNGVVLTTNSGAMLFEGEGREVTFSSTAAFGPGSVGGEVRVDGIVVTGDNANLPIRSGRIAGNMELRDEVINDQLLQLDQIATGLTSIFDDGSGTAMFSYTAGAGIARTIEVNPAVDPFTGGDVNLLRGTGFAAGDGSRLLNISEAFETTLAFDPAAGIAGTNSLNSYANKSLDQLNSRRSFALGESEYQSQLSIQYEETLQSESGVNLDFEMSRLLEVERAYQASARLLSAVDELLATLLEATR